MKRVAHYRHKRVRKGWIVVNCKTGKHAHFRSQYGAYLITKFLTEGIFPDNSYLQESYKRLQDCETKKMEYKNRSRCGTKCYP